MSNDKWFALVEGHVKGPYRQIEIESLLPQWSAPVIWGKGQHEWFSPEKWKMYLQESIERTSQDHERADRQWRVLLKGEQSQPMNYDMMIKLLGNQSELREVRIWTEGYSEWKEVFQIHKIMDDLGVSRRSHPRVPIMGTLTCENNHETFNARLLSISQGGLGATEGKKLKIGDKLRVVIMASQLSQAIPATVEVVFTGREGYFGMKFVGLQSESRNMIADYIERFNSTNRQS